MMGNYHARCGAVEKPEVVTPEAYLSLFGEIPEQPIILQLIREGKPEGECSMLSLLLIDESLNDKVLILCI